MCFDFLSGVIKLDCLVFVIVVESPSSGSVRGWRVGFSLFCRAKRLYRRIAIIDPPVMTRLFYPLCL